MIAVRAMPALLALAVPVLLALALIAGLAVLVVHAWRAATDESMPPEPLGDTTLWRIDE